MGGWVSLLRTKELASVQVSKVQLVFIAESGAAAERGVALVSLLG